MVVLGKKSFLSLFLLIVFGAFSCGDKGKSRIDSVSLVPVWAEDTCRYINDNDESVFWGKYSESSLFRENLALVQTQGREQEYGYIDEDGEFVIAPLYKRATVFSEGLAWVVKQGEAPCAINKKGELKFTLREAENVLCFSEGMAAYSIKEPKGSFWGFVNRNGEKIIDTHFKNAGSFSFGKAAVMNEKGKWGYIDKTGEVIIDYMFDKVKPFYREDRAIVCVNGLWGVINEKGEGVVAPEYSHMRADGKWLLIEKNKKWGWCNEDGSIVIEPRFEKGFNFYDAPLAPVRIDGKWAYINRKGKIKIKRQFDMALPFVGKQAVVWTSTRIGFINEDGRYVINPQYDKISRDYISNALDGQSYYVIVDTDHSYHR